MYVRGEHPGEDGPYRFKVHKISGGSIEYLEDIGTSSTRRNGLASPSRCRPGAP
jgi:hypothetical protein